MGRASAEGEDRAVKAIQKALTSPLLNNNDIHGSKNMLLHITSGAEEVTMDEIGQITDYAQDEAGQNADVIWGLSADPQLGDKVAVTVIATGFDTDVIPEIYAKRADRIEKVTLKTDADDESFEESQTVETTDESNDKEEHILEMDGTPERDEDEVAFVPDDGGMDTEKDSDGREKQKVKQQQWDNKKLEELESVPAYIRRKTKLSSKNSADDSEEISRYTLSDDEDGPEINPDNSYLNNNVD